MHRGNREHKYIHSSILPIELMAFQEFPSRSLIKKILRWLNSKSGNDGNGSNSKANIKTH